MREIVITSSVLIVVILLIRKLFRGKVSQKLIYAAWLLVALRLLVPIQFGQSQYSVAALAENLENQSKPIQQVQEVLQEPVAGPSRAELYEQVLNEYLQQSADPDLPEEHAPITPEIQKQIEEQVDKQITAPTLSETLTIIWITGMCVMAVWFISANLRYMYLAKQGAVPFTACFAPVPVRISSNVPTPCLVGFFRPVIYLTPTSAEHEQSRNHVLTHELTHLRHADHIWALVRCVCLCVYWFDPLVWIAANQSRRDCELACDESALKTLGDGERIAYGKTLLSTVTPSMSPTHLIQTATAMNETKKQLKERVSFIVKKPKNILLAAICMVLIGAITAGCAFMGSQNNEPPVTDPITEPTKPTVSQITEPITAPTKPTEDGYRNVYYQIWTEFYELLDDTQAQDWRDFHKGYSQNEQTEMLLVTFVQRYGISRTAFDGAVEKFIAKSAVWDWNILCEEIEVPNAEIIYTFDNQLINEYYLQSASVYNPLPAFTVLEGDQVPDAAVLPVYEPGSITLCDPMSDEYSFDREYRIAYYRHWPIFLSLLDEDQQVEYNTWLSNFRKQTQYGQAQDEMLLAAFIKHFDIPRDAFEQAVEYYKSAVVLFGYDLTDEEFEAPNVDILYTFDNVLINEYYRL